MADKVMMMENPDFTTGNSIVQRKQNNNGVQVDSLNSVYDVINSSSGKPLDSNTRAFMEPRFGYDFSKVKVHDNEKAADSTRSINALAYTVGNNVVFGNGQYTPQTNKGRSLLAHELTHVVQQEEKVIRKKDVPKTDDEETALGKNIITNASTGLKIGFYDHSEPEMVNKSAQWANSETAIGFSGVKVSPLVSDLTFGKAISDKNDVAKIVNNISTTAKVCVEKAAGSMGITVGEEYKIKTLAFFAHGTSGWCSVSPISGSAGKELIKSVSSNLKNDVDVIIYACSVAASDTDDWYTGTLDSGGKDSMSAGVRDQMYDSNIRAGKVWGHTTVGHVTDNFALRFFSSASKDTDGQSYVSEFVFTPFEEYKIRQAVLKKLTDDGYDVSVIDKDKLIQYQFKNLRKHFYKCYAKANADLVYNGRNLAEAAPNHPIEVADLINEYWDDTYWPKISQEYIKGVISTFKLKK